MSKQQQKSSQLKQVEKPNPILDSLLVGILYVELALWIWTLMNEPTMMMVFGLALVGVALCVFLVKGSFRVSGRYCSRYLLNHLGDPLKKKTTMKKWCDQSWQLAIHVSMAIFEYNILQDETWWIDTPTSKFYCLRLVWR